MMKLVSAQDFDLRREVEYGSPEQNEAVKTIVQAVKTEGDAALLRYTEQFDGMKLGASGLRVTKEELQAAYQAVEPSFVTAIRGAAENIRAFHARQKRNSWMDLQPDGSLLGQIIRPLKRVGVYVPGGKAAYPSSVLMNVIPAQVAGVPEIVMVTPPATGGKAGMTRTSSWPRRKPACTKSIGSAGPKRLPRSRTAPTRSGPSDKICGPGNIYVALAKREVYGVVDIDSIAGPSEIAVLADDSADPAYVAADLLSQAEHDEMASAILVTPSETFAKACQAEVERQLSALPRKAIAGASIERYGAIILVDSIEEGIDVINQLAPEHFELIVDNPMGYLGRVENAGAIFLGPYSSEPVGDYFAGPNHIIPTNGTARFSSPVDVDDFIKKSSLIYYSKEALLENGATIMELARREGLEGHARAIEVRLQQEGKAGNENGQ
ncbi:histidinol dehydrogenase [Paenibacillus sp. HMSSN-139]|nr:histidinol dehydrogenase [Paenibacillus sp. HMSSN-139]